MKSELNRWLVVAILIILVVGTAASFWTARLEDQRMREQLLTQTRLAEVGINAGQVKALTGSESDLISPDYLTLKHQMADLRAVDPEIRFTYLIGRRADGSNFFFVDSEPPESEDYSPPGQAYPEVTVLIKKVFSTGTSLTEGPDTDRWGTWVSGVVPVTDPETGKIIAVYGMDVDARNWYRHIFVASLPPITGTLLVLVLVLTFFLIQQRNERERRRLEASEKAIRESEERYRLLFTRSPIGIVQLDKNGVIVTVNEKFADIIGAPPSQLIGFDTLNQIQNPALVAEIKESLNGKTGFFEGEYISVLGKKRSILRMVSQPIGSGEGTISGGIGIFEDITERYLAEERDKHQTLLFLRTQQALVQMAKLPSDTVDFFLRQLTKIDAETIGIDRVSVWWLSNDLSELVCAECYDRSANSHSCSMHLKRSDYPRFFSALDENRIIAAEDARTDERTKEFANTYLIPLNIMSMLDVPIRRGGQIVGIVCHEHTGQTRAWDPLEQDFTASVADLISSALERAERKAIEEALYESERRYRSVVEDQTELITRFKPDGTLVFVNDAYCRFFSVKRDLIIGKKFSLAITVEDKILIEKHITSLTKDAPFSEITHRIILPDGQVRWLLWIDRAIFNEQGEVVEYQSVGRDISWQKQVEETLSRANQKLNLLSSITRHDVLNQLLVLNGYLQLSSECVHDPEKTLDYLERAIKAVTTIEAQINFTRTYQDMGSIAPSWQNVNTCIIRAIGGLPMVNIQTELHRFDLEVLADPLLEKVFYNLLDNAIRYGGEQMKMIRISSKETPDGLVIVCEDDGAGIAEADKCCLFTQGFGKNTGFGLFLSREILAISGITIRETSSPGRGARFEIKVPKGSFRCGEAG
jgi:PAS domain S-box-containing protein